MRIKEIAELLKKKAVEDYTKESTDYRWGRYMGYKDALLLIENEEFDKLEEQVNNFKEESYDEYAKGYKASKKHMLKEVKRFGY